MCRELLANLQIEQSRKTALTEIKNTLISSNDSSIASSFLKSPELLECMTDSNRLVHHYSSGRGCNSYFFFSEQTLLACDILSICMSNLSIDESTEVKNVIEKSLSHANASVQAFGLRELRRVSSSEAFANETLILLVINCLASEETSVGTPSIDLLVALLPKFVHMRSVQDNLEKLLTANDIVRCRLYEVAVKVGRQSGELLDAMKKFLQKAIQELDEEDILLQLNVLQVLSELPVNNHGMAYLENNGVFDKLMQKIERLEEDPLATILVPGFMRFYGSIATIHPARIYDGYPKIITLLFDCLLSEDLTILPTAYDTLGKFQHFLFEDLKKMYLISPGCIAYPSEGKRQLHYKHGAVLKKTLKHIHGVIRNLPNDIKLRLLSCLTNLFAIDGATADNQIT